MKFARIVGTAIVAFGMMVSVAIACSNCIKAVMTDYEFDRTAWEQSKHVFIATVVASRLIGPNQGRNDIEYTLKANEVLKGDAKAVTRIYGSKELQDWNSEIGAVSCGETPVVVGDRVLVFSGSGGRVSVGPCSASRVVEGASVANSEAVRGTIQRLRVWQK
jgi:hypothetical protein